MVLAGLNQEDYLAILKANGYEVLTDKYWDLEGVERIVLGKDGHTFVIRLKKRYDYLEVIKRFRMLEITNIPEEYKQDYESCNSAYNQDMAQREKWAQARAKAKSAIVEKDKNLDPGSGSLEK
ncbi:MAG: hypothetical protein JST75_03510 [Bacteroidetes bacterium]|nr:hypothetical protein [Bacteroidota bacterium]